MFTIRKLVPKTEGGEVADAGRCDDSVHLRFRRGAFCQPLDEIRTAVDGSPVRGPRPRHSLLAPRDQRRAPAFVMRCESGVYCVAMGRRWGPPWHRRGESPTKAR
jgi:hypothetical protein